ncbi:MAG: MBL fold metallo-hydrolase [Deltaproteobacteria bacterium]|nr:MBL fold metallo-hydrolase [Deltaproteobacteria bacterium]
MLIDKTQVEEKDFPAVRVVKVGTLRLEASEVASTVGFEIKSALGIGGGSTVTLIKANRTILVDTGFDFEWLNTIDNHERNTRGLIRALRNSEAAPDDVDVLFFTHWHSDHSGNLSLFKKAQYMVSKPLSERLGSTSLIGLNDREEIAKGVTVLFTPGHTVDHASLIVDTSIGGVRVRVAIAGDAVISHSYFQSGRIWNYNSDFHDMSIARKSILRIIDHSDIIIPGHGVPFNTFQPEWAKSLMNLNVSKNPAA